MAGWSRILSPSELEDNFAVVAQINRSFAFKTQAFYETRTPEQLTDLMIEAWSASDDRGYQIARSYLALKTSAH